MQYNIVSSYLIRYNFMRCINYSLDFIPQLFRIFGVISKRLFVITGFDISDQSFSRLPVWETDVEKILFISILQLLLCSVYYVQMLSLLFVQVNCSFQSIYLSTYITNKKILSQTLQRGFIHTRITRMTHVELCRIML